MKGVVTDVVFINAVNKIQKRVNDNSRSKGFWEGDANQNIPTKLMLIVSELSEAMEVHRSGEAKWSEKLLSILDNKDSPDINQTIFAEEMADVVIRVMDLCQWLGIDLGRVILDKAKYNEGRPKMHGGKKY